MIVLFYSIKKKKKERKEKKKTTPSSNDRIESNRNFWTEIRLCILSTRDIQYRLNYRARVSKLLIQIDNCLSPNRTLIKGSKSSVRINYF